jgi:hypothetical protein
MVDITEVATHHVGRPRDGSGDAHHQQLISHSNSPDRAWMHEPPGVGIMQLMVRLTSHTSELLPDTP